MFFKGCCVCPRLPGPARIPTPGDLHPDPDGTGSPANPEGRIYQIFFNDLQFFRPSYFRVLLAFAFGRPLLLLDHRQLRQDHQRLELADRRISSRFSFFAIVQQKRRTKHINLLSQISVIKKY